MLAPRLDLVIEISAEGETLSAAIVMALHGNGKKRRILDLDQNLLRRSHQEVAPVVLASHHRGEKLDERLTSDWAPTVEPRAVTCDLEANIAALLRHTV